MTPDASLPPADVQHTCFAGPILEDRCAVCNKEFRADVQRPTPPLTEAELAEMEREVGWATDERVSDLDRPYHAALYGRDVPRLIADLRASSERIKELEEDLKGKMTRQEWYEDYARW